MVQKMNIDTPNKESKSQRGITERGAAQGVLYQSILNAKLTGGGGKGAQVTDERKLENTVKEKPIQRLGRASQGVN